MIINEEQALYLENIMAPLLKAKDFNIGAIYRGTLYLMVNNGMMYTVDVSSVIPTYIEYFFIENVRYPIYPTRFATDSIISMMKDIANCNGTGYSYSPLVFDNPDIMEDENFKEMMEAKSADGAFRYFFPINGGNTFVYIMKGMFNLTKSDKCTFKAYDGGLGRYIARFDIYKKKTKQSISLYFSFLDVVKKGAY